MLDPSAWIANSMPIDEPPMLGGVASSSHACSTARIEKKKKPRKAMKKANAVDLPAKIMNTMMSAVTAMLLMMIWRRPTLSERWPEIGPAMKRAVWSAAMAAPIQIVE